MRSTILILILIFVNVLQATMPLISLSGSGLTGVTGHKQKGNFPTFQFQSAFDLTATIDYSDKLSASTTIGINPSNSNGSDFPSDLTLQALQINYSPNFYNTNFIAGLTNIPFGQFNATLTNNSIKPSVFLVNDIG